MITETDKAYLAGLIDGDGCITILKQERKHCKFTEYKLTIILINTHKETLDYLKGKYNVGRIYKKKLDKLSKKDVYHWMIQDQNAEDLLWVIRDYMKIKKLQLELALSFRRTFGKRPIDFELREWYYQQLKDLKHTKERRGN